MGKKVPMITPTSPTRPRNAFDLSQRHLFTAPAGALLPVLSLDLMPHDHVEIDASDFMRTLPMNSAAFASIRGVYEFFFVPYHQLWNQFDQFVTGMKDYRSSAYATIAHFIAPEKTPYFMRNKMTALLTALDQEKDIMGFKKLYNVCRLFDLLGYGRPYTSSGTMRSTFSRGEGSFSIFRLAAYQKIYSDYYRNTQYESYDVGSFNFDDVSGEVPLDRMKKLCELRYRSAQLDYLTDVVPSVLFLDGLTTSFTSPSNVPGFDSSGLRLDSSTVSFNVSSSGDFVSVGDLRAMFAIEKLLSITSRAGKTYAEQIKAHFGVKVSEGRDGKVNYLGGFDSDFQIGDVTQLSGTGDTSLPQYAGYLGKTTGKAIGSGKGSIKFDCKDFGVLMCIYSVVPAMQYDANRVDPFVEKITRGDYFIPEFENLGLQPSNAKYITDTYGSSPVYYGYQPRYMEYKSALDLNHGQFCAGEPLSYWSVGRMRASNEKFDNFNYLKFKINPLWLNSIFAVDYNGKEITDQFFGGCYFNIQKVSDMSEVGLPRI